MSAPPRIVSAGYMPLDAILTKDGLIAHRAGGTAANVAAVLAYLGWQALLAGQVGEDSAGRTLVADLVSAGVDTTHIHGTAGMQTPRLIHSVRRDGHSFLYRCPTCDRPLPRSRPLTVEQARLLTEAQPETDVYFFDRANAATLLLAEHYARAGATIVFEPSVPANAEHLRRAAAVAHVIKYSDDRSVGGLNDVALGQVKGQLRILTHGVAGLELRLEGGRVRRFPALSTNVVDAGGAGDWTTAGLLAVAANRGQLDRRVLDRGLRFGQALAALSCMAIGARGLMALTRRTVMHHARSAMEHGAVRSPLRLPRPVLGARVGDGCVTCMLPRGSSDASGRRARSAAA